MLAAAHSRREQCWSTGQPWARLCLDGRSGRVEVSDNTLDRWLLLRVGGPHPQVALFERVNASSWQAHFRVCRSGRYTLVIRAMMLQPWQEWFHNWTEYPQRTPCAGSWAERKLLQHNFIYSGHSADPKGCMTGLWSWGTVGEGTANYSIASEKLEDLTPALHPNHSALESIYGMLHFTEQPSSHHSLPPPSPSSLPSSLRICVFGDSHMRTLADNLVQRLVQVESKNVRCRRPLKTPTRCDKNMNGGATCLRSVCVGESYNVTVRYYRSEYGTELSEPFPRANDPPLENHLARSCSSVLFNSGQWWAAYKLKPKLPPWAAASEQPTTLSRSEARSPAIYSKVMAGVMARIAALAARSALRVAWVSTNPTPVNAGGKDYEWFRAKPYDMSRCPPTERRFPHVLHAYNEEARRHAAAHGVPYIDTWEVALPLLDLSEDGAHYALGVTPVAHPQTNRVLAWVLAPHSAPTRRRSGEREPLRR